MSKKRNKKIISTILFSVCAAASLKAQKTDVPPYLNPKLPIEDRITDLLPRLTLEEKITQLSDSWGSKGIPRLHVPAMLKTEGLHGQSYSTGATIFPQAIMMASTFDTTLIHNVGKFTAVEAKAAGIRVTWSPVLDVARDARWGRVEETYGEDPYTVSRMGVAWINGFQGEHMIAVPKHFAGHGEPLGGRDSHDVGLSDRVMRDVHLVPFRAAVKEAHVGGVMAAYSTWDAVPDNGSPELLQKILREEWGFDGIVVSDCSGPENFYRKQSVVANLDEAAKLSILTGVDIECGSVNTFTLAGAIKRGVINEADLDVNLRRVFRAKYRLGLFDNPAADKMVWDKLPSYDTPEHRAAAKDVAEKGIVLLKNEKNMLPLSKDVKTIAVIGPNADIAQTGDYSAKAAPGQLITVLQGIKSHVGANTTVLYEKGCNSETLDSSGFAAAEAAAAKADVVVMVVGDYSNNNPAIENKEKNTSGENVDGATLEFPGVQRQLIKRIAATGKPIVLVLVNGKPVTLSWEDQHIPAIMETWYPGEEGGNATADILFGDTNPSGRLPVTFPRNVGQLPLRYDYLPSGRNYDYYDMPFTPLYRFGYGLSYTTFKYSDLKTNIGNDGIVHVSVDLTNTGNRAGDEVAQLYLTDVLTTVITPIVTLQGFQRVHLEKGEKKTLDFTLTPYQLSLLNASMERVVEPGKFRVHVGGASPEFPGGNTELKLKVGYKDAAKGVSGEFDIKTPYKASFSATFKTPATVKSGVPFPLTVNVTNDGNIEDIANIKVLSDTLLGDYRSEVDPAQTFPHTFNITLYKSGQQTVTIMVGNKIWNTTVNVQQSPAKLVLDNPRVNVDDNGKLHYEALAMNSGSASYSSDFKILVDGKPVVSQPLSLKPGEKRSLQYDYTFPASGNYKVRIGNEAEQQLVIPGGVNLTMQNPLVYLDFDGSDAKDAISGKKLKVEGEGQFVDGKEGKAFYTGDKKNFISAGGLDLYRKSFTLATWVKIEKYDGGQAMFFGGEAPMGADVDKSGTIMAAGIQGENMLSSFQDRDVKGGAKVPAGQWVHLAYAYDAQNGMGSLYLNGKLDKTAAQKSYAGPLEMIGSATRFNHGKYAMDDVLVTDNYLSAENIKSLSTDGINALRKGTVSTQWLKTDKPVTTLQYIADVPANTQAELLVETLDAAGKPAGSKTVQLKSGTQSVALDGLNGVNVHIKATLTSSAWNAVPTVRAITLSAGNTEVAKWSFANDWKKATISGGVGLNN